MYKVTTVSKNGAKAVTDYRKLEYAMQDVSNLLGSSVEGFFTSVTIEYVVPVIEWEVTYTSQRGTYTEVMRNEKMLDTFVHNLNVDPGVNCYKVKRFEK